VKAASAARGTIGPH